MWEFFKRKGKETKALASLPSLNLAANINPNLAIYPQWDIANHPIRYATQDDVYSIIKMISTHAALINLYAYEVQDEKVFKQLKKIKQPHQNPYQHKNLITKALVDLPEQDMVAELLERPCESMSKFEFYEAIYTFLLIFGEAFILKQRPTDGVNAGKPVTLDLLYPQNVILRVTQTLPRRIVGFDYRIHGSLIYENLSPDDVIHIKYFNPEMDYLGAELRGVSPLQVLHRRMTRMDKEMDVSVSQLTNGGVPGILFDKDPESIEIMGERQRKLYEFLNKKDNKGAPYSAAGDLGYIQLGALLADMGVAELANIDFKKLCNAYAVSDRLFNNDATGSEISDTNARKGLYVNAALPNVYRVRDALINGLLPDFKDGTTMVDEDGTIATISGDGKKRYIEADISEIQELHEDMAKKVAQYSNLPIMIPNQILEELGFPKIEDDPLMDKVYVKTGYVLLDDIGTPIEPLPVVTPNGN